jgi:hypothetical protein
MKKQFRKVTTMPKVIRINRPWMTQLAYCVESFLSMKLGWQLINEFVAENYFENTS